MKSFQPNLPSIPEEDLNHQQVRAILELYGAADIEMEEYFEGFRITARIRDDWNWDLQDELAGAKECNLHGSLIEITTYE